MNNPIDIYLQQFDGLKLKKLRELRIILQRALPEAKECIPYGIPAYRTDNVLYILQIIPVTLRFVRLLPLSVSLYMIQGNGIIQRVRHNFCIKKDSQKD